MQSQRTFAMSPALLLLGFVAFAGSSLPELSGTVADDDGRPVADAMVVVTEGPPVFRFLASIRQRGPVTPDVLAAGQSDRDGRFKLALPDATPESGWRRTRLAVWTYRPDVALDVRLVASDWPSAGLPLAITLSKAQRVALRVVDPDGKPIGGARISPHYVRGQPVPATVGERLRAITNADGRASLMGVSPNDLEAVQIAAKGYGVQWAAPRVDPGADSAVVTLSPVGRVVGHVAADNPKVIAGVRIWLTTHLDPSDDLVDGGLAELVSDEQGRFEAPALAAGTLSLYVEPTETPVYMSAQQDGPPVEAGQAVEFNVPLQRAVRVIGVVQDRADGTPVPRVLMQLRAWQSRGPRAFSDEAGRYVSYVLPEFVTPLAARIPPPYFNPNETLNTQPIAADREEVTLRPLLLARGQPVRGRVIDEAGRLVAGAELEGFWPMSSEAYSVHGWSDAEGKFVIEGVDPEVDLRLWATHRERASGEPMLVHLADNAPVTLTIGPENCVALDGRVVDASGRPIAGAVVRVLAQQRQAAAGQDPVDLGPLLFDGREGLLTDAEGRFRTPRSLRPQASYSLAVAAPGRLPSETETIDPLVWKTTTFADVVLHAAPRLRTVAGRVIDGDGRPVTGVRVWQSGDGSRRTETVSGTDGGFRLDGVYEGPAFVFAQRDGFRLEGLRVSDNAENCTIALHPTDEPAQRMTTLPTEVPLDEQRGLALRLIEPLRPMLKDKTEEFVSDHFRLMEIVARCDPAGALELADTVITDAMVQNFLRVNAASELAETDPEEMLTFITAVPESWMRAKLYLAACDAADGDRPHQTTLLDEALLHARAENDAGQKVHLIGQIAERWLDLGDRERGTALLREGQVIAEELPAPTETTRHLGEVHARARFAGSLARIDGPAALKLVVGFGLPQQDWYYADVARGWADYDAAEAERVWGSMQYANLRFSYGLAVLHRMAATDADRAEAIARRYDSADHQAYALGLVAHALAALDPSAARRLLDDAFAILEKAHRAGHVARSGTNSAAVAAALLPVAERIQPEIVRAYFWRSLALRPPRSARLDVSGNYELAELAALVARYDREAARDLLRPFAARFRELAAREEWNSSHVLRVMMAIAVTDPRWAVQLVDALPDAPSTAPHNMKRAAARMVAGFLGHSDRSLRRLVYLYVGLRDPDRTDVER